MSDKKSLFIKNIIDTPSELLGKTSPFHNHMVLDRGRCEELTRIPGKTTAIIPTYNSSIDCFMWSIFSLLLRSSDNLEQIIVCINGPDERTGDPTNQDNKQAFLEDLRRLKWNGKDMPLTINRIWSRIGHGESVEGAIPWVHTEAYTLLHDDVIVTNPTWAEETFTILQDDSVAAVYSPPCLGVFVSTYDEDYGKKLNLPHVNTPFITCKKALIKERWTGYHVDTEFNLDELGLTEEFVKFHEGVIATKEHDRGARFRPHETHSCLSVDFGGWVFYQIKSDKYKLVPVRMVEHILSMSWNERKHNLKAHQEHIVDLEMELINTPEYWQIYKKYKTFNSFTQEYDYKGSVV